MNSETKQQLRFPLRLSPTLRAEATMMASDEGISLNHFISLSIAEKLSRMEQRALRKDRGEGAAASAQRPRPHLIGVMNKI